MRGLLTKSGGLRASLLVADRTYSSEQGAAEAYIWNDENQIFSYPKNFLARLERARAIGEILAFIGARWSLEDITAWLTGGQSNAEGAASLLKFLAWLDIEAPKWGMTRAQVLDLIGPTSLVGGNTSGIGGDAIIGPGHVFAAFNAMRTRKPQFIIDVSTGTQTVELLWGTNGEDGSYKVQRDHANTYGGAPGAEPPSLVNPAGYGGGGIKRVLLWAQGEAEVGLIANPTQPTHFRGRTVQLLNKHVSDYPDSPVPGIVVYQLAPSNWGTEETHPWQPYIRDELGTLANAAGTETNGIPVVVDQYADTDMIPSDKPHIDLEPDETRGWVRICRPRFNAMVAAGWI